MSDSPAQAGKLSATLTLEDDSRLHGVLSTLLDGRLQLESVEPLDDPDPMEPIAVERGSPAVLSVDGGVQDEALHRATVTISDIYDDNITLVFAAGDAAIASKLRETIAGGFGPGIGKIVKPPAPSPPPEPVLAAAESSEEDIPEHNPFGLAPTVVAATAEYTALLEQVEKDSLSELERALIPFLNDLTSYMLELSNRMRMNDKGGKNMHYHAATLLRKQSGNIAERMLQQIKGYFLNLTPKSDDDQLWHFNAGNVDKLDLIGIDEFDDYLAIDRMVAQGEERHRMALEALTVRMATLVDVDPNKLRLPIHVRQISRAFQSALDAQSLSQNTLTHIFDYFSKRFISQLEGYYEPINEMLAEADVCPRVESEIRMKGSLLKGKDQNIRPPRRLKATKSTRAPEEEDGHGLLENLNNWKLPPEALPVEETGEAPALAAPMNQSAEPPAQINPNALYRSVVDALNFKREAEGLTDGSALDGNTRMSGTWDGATVASESIDESKLADAQSIAKVLAALQHNTQAREDVQKGESLRAYLASNRDDIDSLQNTSGLTTESLNQLDLVDNLFGTIKSEMDVSAKLKPALGDLKIPLAKLALLDEKFFADQNHSARTVVDRLSKLAAAANFPNRALETRIGGIVDQIIDEYESDASVFDVALQKIDKLAAQQERALSRNVERVVRTQEGQEKLAQARREVDEIIHSRLPPPDAPKVLVDLVESGWRDLMVLTHLREGADSDALSKQAALLDRFHTWLDDQRSGRTDLLQLKERSEAAIELIGKLDNEISNALPTHIEHEASFEHFPECDTCSGQRQIACRRVREAARHGLIAWRV